MNSTRHQGPHIDAEAEGFSAALDALGLAWWIKDDTGRYLQAGQATAALLGVEADALIGRHDGQILSRGSAESLAAIEQQALQAGGVQRSEQVIEIGGVRIDLACAVVKLRAEPRSPTALLGVWLDRRAQRAREAELRAVLVQLEAQQQSQRELRAEADSPAARGLARVVGRDAFEEHLAREIDLSVREHREFAVVLMDIDAGTEGDGDAHRRMVEVFDGMLRSNTRAMDVPARQDGAGFALLLSGVGLATAHSRMEGLRRQCATQVVARRGEALHFTVSMGVASYPHTAETRAGLLGAAQAALDQARERGGNQVALASITFAASKSGP